MSNLQLNLELLNECVPDGLDSGTNLLVEFEPRSIWYETSLTIAVDAMRKGLSTTYHVFQQSPTNITKILRTMGLDVDKLQEEDILRILDSYTVQIGIGSPEKVKEAEWNYLTQSVKLVDWSIGMGQQIKGAGQRDESRRFHIDDNTGVLLQYNDEKTMIDCWRTRVIPNVRRTGVVTFFSLAKGVASEAFYRQFESLCDGLIEFRNQEGAKGIEQEFRLTTLRGKTYDSRWRRLQLIVTGEVKLAD